MTARQRQRACVAVLLGACMARAVASGAVPAPADAGADSGAALEKIGLSAGVCAVVGLPKAGPRAVVDLAKGNELLVYFQSPRADEVLSVRRAAEKAGLLGKRIFAARGDGGRIGLADNLAGAVLVSPAAGGRVAQAELLRVLHPQGKAIVAGKQIVKPQPEGIDAWSHPFHGPDNNPQSTDEVARAPYLTQFITDPKFCPYPTITVAAAGRVFKAFGHRATRANQNDLLNTLLCINAYNGAILWKRPLQPGFMILRNTMIATPRTLFLADDRSCKLIDPRTGRLKRRIVIPAKVPDSRVWKWMALDSGVLYALTGGGEVEVKTSRSASPLLGSWPVPLQESGYDYYKDAARSPGFGRTFIAVNPQTGELLWHHREKELIDSRGVCMTGGRIFFYSPGKFLACLGTKAGRILWKVSGPDLMKAIGTSGRKKHRRSYFAETPYVMCSAEVVFLAGYQRDRLVAVSAADGRLLWQQKDGNYHLVLREDGAYFAGDHQSGKFDYATGKVRASFGRRRACTRATGSIDSVFWRAAGGTVLLDVASGRVRHIAPIRPPCLDGVIVSEGLLYWGPWMCSCQLSLYGHVALGPAGGFNFRPGCEGEATTAGSAGEAAAPCEAPWRSPAADEGRLERAEGFRKPVKAFAADADDWPGPAGVSGESPAVTRVAIPARVRRQWTFRAPSRAWPTAPTAAGGLVFAGDRTGVVRALDAADGKQRWQAYTGGAIFGAPAVLDGRLYVGSADGHVYAFEAATGRRLWRFRAAPARRRIPVYGELISTWPVAGGVVAKDGVVYAAAGIAHYDGTYVYALDAVTGKVRWCNDTSGTLPAELYHGVSLQGFLYVRGGELRFAGGGVYATARYDLKTGKFLNPPDKRPSSHAATAFYPYYPRYGRFVSLEHRLPDGRRLSYESNHRGRPHAPLGLFRPLPPGTPEPPRNWRTRRTRGARQPVRPRAVWQDKARRRFNALVVAPRVVLGAGPAGLRHGASHGAAASPAEPAVVASPSEPGEGESFLTAIRTRDGSDVWTHRLSGAVVRSGLAVDAKGRIFVTTENGEVLCLSQKGGGS